MDGLPDPDDPQFGLPFLDDLMRLLSAQTGRSWDTARQMAVALASGGTSEPNVDPSERIRIEELTRVAEMHIARATGLTLPAVSPGPAVTPTTRSDWAARTLDAYRPVFDRLTSSLGGDPTDTDPTDLDPGSAMFNQILRMVSPQMLGMATGSMVGHLAQVSLGGYDLPYPRPLDQPLLVISGNLAETSTEWNLEADDLRMWVLLHELAHHAVFGVPHVRAEVERLVLDHASGYRPDARALEDRLSGVDPTDPASLGGLQQMFGDPEVLLGAVRSDLQKALLPHLEAVVAVVIGVVDHALDTAGAAVLGGDLQRLREALARRRTEADSADRFLERLIGIDLQPALIERGHAFVAGVLERADEAGLAQLWESDTNLPTPAEVDAPGLWLARIEL